MFARLLCLLLTSVLVSSLSFAAKTEVQGKSPFVKPPDSVQPAGGLSFEEEWSAAHTLPHARQVAWQEDGFVAFVHVGPNTFTGNEWGSGEEDPKVFNPTELDARQWVKALKSAGAKKVILTAKHHDGFCLWPSRFTAQSVKKSGWRSGKGDVVRDVADACREEGLKLGIYLSPADLNAIHIGVYGQTEKKKRVIPTPVSGWSPKSKFSMEGEWDDYNAYFLNQLFELLTEYGEVHEVWFDGANPKDVGQKYAYSDWYRIIRELAPKAMIFGKGPDCRWIGNEGGNTRQNEWNVIPSQAGDMFNDRCDSDLGSREKIKGAQQLIWYPGETDVSIRPGWFYHGNQDNSLHSLDRLLEMWYGASGGNAVLLLNVPPNTKGLLAEGDVKRLAEMGQVLRATFAENLARGAKAKSGQALKDHAAGLALDGKNDTCWRPEDWQRSAEIEFTLTAKKKFNIIELREDITHFGQRVEKHAVDIWTGGQWKQVVEWGTIGGRRLHRLKDAVETDRLRVRFLESRVCPTLAEFGLYFERPRLAAPKIVRSNEGAVTIESSSIAKIYYTVDGTKPTEKSKLYGKPFELTGGGVVKAMVASDSASVHVGEPVTVVEFGPSKAKWKVVSVLTEEAPGEAATHAIDDNPATVWHSKWRGGTVPFPHEITVDMGEALNLKGMTYMPRNQGPWTRNYEFFTSENGRAWTQAAAGEFGNIKNNPVLQTVKFEPRKARYFKFVSKTEADGQPFTCVAELGVLVK